MLKGSDGCSRRLGSKANPLHHVLKHTHSDVNKRFGPCPTERPAANMSCISVNSWNSLCSFESTPVFSPSVNQLFSSRCNWPFSSLSSACIPLMISSYDNCVKSGEVGVELVGRVFPQKKNFGTPSSVVSDQSLLQSSVFSLTFVASIISSHIASSVRILLITFVLIT